MITKEDIEAMSDTSVEDFWDLDISKAPLGRTERVMKMLPKKQFIEVDMHIPEYILAASACGVVTRSRWLPESGRWEMFTKEVPPVAWMMWPKYNKGD